MSGASQPVPSAVLPCGFHGPVRSLRDPTSFPIAARPNMDTVPILDTFFFGHPRLTGTAAALLPFARGATVPAATSITSQPSRIVPRGFYGSTEGLSGLTALSNMVQELNSPGAFTPGQHQITNISGAVPFVHAPRIAGKPSAILPGDILVPTRGIGTLRPLNSSSGSISDVFSAEGGPQPELAPSEIDQLTTRAQAVDLLLRAQRRQQLNDALNDIFRFPPSR